MRIFLALVVALFAAALGYGGAAFIVDFLAKAQLEARLAGDITGFIFNAAPMMMLIVIVGLPIIFAVLAYRLMRRYVK